MGVDACGSSACGVSMRPGVRRWLDNYQKLKEAIEAICELNHRSAAPG